MTGAGKSTLVNLILRFYDVTEGRVLIDGTDISGGQKQRIAIARALLTHPASLILDDSTSSVDVETETKIQTAMENIRYGRLDATDEEVVEAAKMADKELLDKRGFYHHLYVSQFKGEAI